MQKIQVLSKKATDKQKDAALMALGWTPRDWQLVEMHRMRKRTEYGLNMARQNGKSNNDSWYAIEHAVFYGESGAISVHNDTLKQKLLRELKSDLRKCFELGLVEKFLNGDDARVHFNNGAVVAISIRGDSFVSGLTLDFLIHDEAQKMDQDIMDEANPVLRNSLNGLVAYIGTPQTDRDYKKYGVNRFTELLEEDNDAMRNCAAYPWYTEEVAAIETLDWKRLAKANPSWRHIPRYKQDMTEKFKTMDRERFWNQYGAVPKRRDAGDLAKPPRFTNDEVEAFLTLKGSIATRFILSIGITQESDRAYAAMNDGRTTEIMHRWEIPYGELHEIAEAIRDQARMFTQIRISATPRGRALADMLKERKLGAKLKLMDMPTTSSNLNLLIDRLQKAQLRVCEVDSKQETKTALTSFWMELHTRSGGAIPVSTMKSQEALIVALANSVVDEQDATRLQTRNRFSPEVGEAATPEIARPKRRHAW